MIYVPESLEKEAVRACLRERIKTLEEVLQITGISNNIIRGMLEEAKEKLRYYK